MKRLLRETFNLLAIITFIIMGVIAFIAYSTGLQAQSSASATFSVNLYIVEQLNVVETSPMIWETGKSAKPAIFAVTGEAGAYIDVSIVESEITLFSVDSLDTMTVDRLKATYNDRLTAQGKGEITVIGRFNTEGVPNGMYVGDVTLSVVYK